MYVLNGKVVLYPDGTGVDKQESDNVLYVQDVQTGELFTIAPNRISELAEATDPQAVIAEREEAIAAAMNQEIEQEEGAEGGTAAPKPTTVPETAGVDAPQGGVSATQQQQTALTYESGSRFTLDLPNGSAVNGVVLQVTPDGVEVQTSSPVNGRFVQVFPTDEFDGMLSSVRDEEGDVIWSKWGAGIPVDAKTGEPVYDAVAPDVAWDAIVQEAEGDEAMAMQVVTDMVADMEAKVQKAKKAKVRAGSTVREKLEAQKKRKRQIEEAEAQLEAWKRIAAVKAERIAAAERAKIEAADAEGGTERDKGRVGTENEGRGNKEKENDETEVIGSSMTADEALDFIADMELGAEIAPEIDLTIENWDALFGKEGIVSTPIGNVKMGENQFTKLMRQGRNGKLGMIKPTLEHPHAIIADVSEAKEGDITERASSYVFIRSFKKVDGSRYYYFTSITVSKDGKEVVISNQEKRRNAIANLLTKGKLVWKHADDVSDASDMAQGLYSSQGNVSDLATEGTDAPQTTRSSTGKDTPENRAVQTSGQENAETSSEGGISSISHAENQSAPAISLQSRGDVVSISNTTGKDTPQNSAVQTFGQENAETSLQSEVTRAEQQTNAEPTEGQKEAGNYKKGRVKVGPFDVVIEQPRGSVRSGVDANGKAWETTMQHTYGYFGGTKGVDGDAIDVFLAHNLDEWDGTTVFVVDQYNPDGSFDEHKVMLGFNSQEEAEGAYFANYEADWAKTHRTEVTAVPLADFNEWVNSSKRKTKPFAEYKVAKRSAEIDAHNEQNEQRAEQLFSMAKEAETEKDFFDRAASLFEVTGYQSDLRDIYNGVKSGEIANARALSFYTNATLKPVAVETDSNQRNANDNLQQLYTLIDTALAGGNSSVDDVKLIRSLSDEELVLAKSYKENRKGRLNKAKIDVSNIRRHILDEIQERQNRKDLAKTEKESYIKGLAYFKKNVYPGFDFENYIKNKEKEYREAVSKGRLGYAAILKGVIRAIKEVRVLAEQKESANETVKAGVKESEPKQATKNSKAGEKARKHAAQPGAPAVSTQEATLRDALVDVAQQSGLEVVVDEKAQQVLDEVNGNGAQIRLQAKLSSLSKAAKVIHNWIARNAQGKVFTIELPESTCRMIRNVMGRDFDSHNITINGIRHGLKNHGVEGKKLNANSIPIREEDAELIPYIMTAPDYVRKGSEDVTGRESVRFYKTLSNGYVVVVEKEYKNSPNDMETINIWAEMSSEATNAQRRAVPDTNVQNAILSTDAAKIRKDAEDAIRKEEKLREHRVFHGSGAEFDAFDHSHMGEGEGAQAYGWGTYVTEVEGIGRMYAESYKAGMFKSGFGDSFLEELKEAAKEGKFDEVKQQLLGHYRYLYDSEKAKGVKKDDAFISDYEMLERIKEEDIPSKFLYTVEIPEDNGENYLSWYEPLTSKDIKRIGKLLDSKKMKFDGIKASTYLKKREGEIKGFTAYLLLGDAFGYGQKPASEALMQAGYTGISYPAEARSGGRKDGARNFVIFNEKDAQITDHIRFFRTPGGEAYGFTVDGKIYLDPRIATAETPIHEYAHLWADMIRNVNAEAWNDIVGLMKATPIWEEVRGLYPELKTDDEIADEVLAHYSGRRGAERLRDAQQQAAAETGKSVFERAAAVAAIERVKQALAKFWQSVAELFHIRFTSAEEVADRVLADMLNGVNPNKYIKRKGKGTEADFDIVSSVFGKRRDSVAGWINKGYMRYVDKEKALNYLHLSAPIAEASDKAELSSATKVVKDFVNPQLSEENNEDLLFRTTENWDANSGYTQREDGTRVSRRAKLAEAEGTFMKGAFITRYGLTRVDFDLLNTLGIIQLNEWHHTGANFKESNYYAWADSAMASKEGVVDYSESVPDGSLASIYQANKKEIAQFAKLFKETDWEYQHKRQLHPIPSLEEFIEANVQLNEEERAELQQRHTDISSKGYEAGSAYQRMLMHTAVDNSVKQKAVERYLRENTGELERVYNEQYGEIKAENAKIEAMNSRIDEFNANTRGKEYALQQIAEIFGKDAILQIKKVSAEEQAKVAKEEAQQVAERQKKADEAELNKKKKAFDKWIENKKESGKITAIVRLPKKKAPEELFVKEKEEKKSRNEWVEAHSFDPNTYVSGLQFNSRRAYNTYQRKQEEIAKREVEIRQAYMDAMLSAGRLSDLMFRPISDSPQRLTKYHVEKIFGGIWIADKQEFAKFAAAVNNFGIEHDGEGIAYTDNYLYAYYYNIDGVAIPYASVYLNADVSQDLIKEIQDDPQGNKVEPNWFIIQLRNEYAKSRNNNGYNSGLRNRRRNGTFRSNILRKGRYLDNPSLYVKTGRADGNGRGERGGRGRIDEDTLRQGASATNSSRPTVASLQAHAEKLVERLHLTNVEIVTDASQLEGKQRTAKGFYNKRTGKITIVLPNHASTADVEQTLLHEAVAHYGLRQLFGEHFDDFLDMVYRNAEEGIRRKIAEASAKHGWNVRTATEEYLADLAERTDFENTSPTWWAKIKDFFLNMLRGLGFEAMDGQTLTDNELRYVLWRSYENLTEPGKYPTFIAEARDVAKQHALQVGRFAPTETVGSRVAENEALSEEEMSEILFRDGSTYNYTQVLARDRYERRIKSGMYQTKEALQDSMLGLRTAMESILEAEGRKGVYIEDIDGFENAYLGENRLSSVNQAEAEKFAREVFAPMLEEVSKLAPTADERAKLIDYLFAKHGLERNEVMARRAAAKEARKEFEKELRAAERAVAKQKRALETASLENNSRSLTVVSSADGANVQKVLDILVTDLTEMSNRSHIFLGDLAQALGASTKSSSSQYGSVAKRCVSVVFG